MLRTLLASVAFGVLTYGVTAADDEAVRIKVPPLSEREAAAKLVRELFKDEYAKAGAAAKADLALKLLKQADESKDDPAAQFVLYKEAAELAAAGGKTDLAVRACEAFAQRFNATPAEGIESALKTMSARASTPDACLQTATFVMKLIDDAIAADDIDSAERLAKIAELTALRAKNVRLVKQLQAQGRDIELFKSNREKVATATATLKTKPDDPDANAVLGKFYCFLKGDWDKGLPMLAKSGDAKLKLAAEKDLVGDEGPTAMASGDAWYEVLGTLEGYPKKALQFCIHELYTKALPTATGLAKAKLEKRLDELDKSLDGKWDYPALWPMLRTAVRNKLYDEIEPMGGAFSDKEYTEIIPDGGILIGFNYTLKPFFDKELIDCFQPIYLTASGEKLGTPHGNFKAGKMLTVKAKPNYAIGKMAIRGGGLWGGVNVHFMRIDGKGLKASDTYETGWIGHKDQPNSPFLGDGRPIVGLHGKLQNERDGAGICSIGLYVVGEKPKK